MSVKKVLVGVVALVSGLAMLARTQAQSTEPNQVYIDDAVLALWNVSQTSVLVEITAECRGGTGTVNVTVNQTATESNSNMTASTGTGSSSVKCDGNDRTIGVAVGPSLGSNLGLADIVVTLTVGTSTPVMKTKTVPVGFPAIEHSRGEEHD